MTQIKTAQESLKFWLNNQDTWLDKFANFNLEKFKDYEISGLRARVAELEAKSNMQDEFSELVSLIKSDSFAITMQSLAQYRGELLRYANNLTVECSATDYAKLRADVYDTEPKGDKP